MRRILIAMACAGASACATSNPGPSADIHYSLPATSAQAVLTLEYKGCKDLGGGKAEFDIERSLTIVAKAGAELKASGEPLMYPISGDQLRSARQTRDLTVSVNKAGVITGLNTADADRTPQIVGNVVGAVVKVAGLAFNPIPTAAAPTAEDKCNELVKKVPAGLKSAFLQATKLESKIKTLQMDLPASAANGNADKIRDQIDLLARELARIRVDVLTRATTAPIPLERGNILPEKVDPTKDATENADATKEAETIEFKVEPFEVWGAGYTEFLEGMLTAEVNAKLVFPPAPKGLDLKPEEVKGASTSDQKDPNTNTEKKPRPDCDPYIVVPRPRLFDLTVTLPKIQGVTDDKDVVKTETLPIAQWSLQGYVCLDLAFGESRSIALKFDDFGRTTSFGWKSNARAEAVTGFMNTAVDQAAAYQAATEGETETARMARETKELETRQKYNKILKCQAIIEAGGFECDPAD